MLTFRPTNKSIKQGKRICIDLHQVDRPKKTFSFRLNHNQLGAAMARFFTSLNFHTIHLNDDYDRGLPGWGVPHSVSLVYDYIDKKASGSWTLVNGIPGTADVSIISINSHWQIILFPTDRVESVTAVTWELILFITEFPRELNCIEQD